jgi:adenylate kinase
MKLQKIIVVLGPPGSGKGTQSIRLAQALGYTQIVLGDLIRAFIKGTTPESLAAKELYDKGIPQPDTVATSLLQQRLQTMTESEGAVFDTYPLSMGQAEALDKIVESVGVEFLRVVFLNVEKDEVVKRITSRGQGRTDDTPEIAGERYDEYEKRNAPIKEHYRNKGVLIEINGMQDIDAVHQEIMDKVANS